MIFCVRNRLYTFYILFAFSSQLSPILVASLAASEIRLDRPGLSMENVSIKDQKGLPFCYSFAATQMLDAFRSVYDQDYSPEDDGTSAVAGVVWSAWDSELNYNQTLNYGGFLCEAVDSLTKFGRCKEEKTAAIFKSFQLSHGKKTSTYESQLVEDRFQELIDSPLANEYIEGRDQDQFKMKILKGLVDRACSGASPQDFSHLRPKCLTIKRLAAEEREGEYLLKRVDRELDLGKKALPVGIKFCSNIFDQDPSYKGVEETLEKKGRIFWKKNCHIHYSLAIGKRWNKEKGKKEFLIRDSYGADCGRKSLHESWACDDGAMWVSEDILVSNILEINLLRSPLRSSEDQGSSAPYSEEYR